MDAPGTPTVDPTALWSRFDASYTEAEKFALLPLLVAWQYDTGTLVAYEDDEGKWVDVEPDWSITEAWLR